MTVETLESRTVMSAAATTFSAAVTADRLQVKADLLKFRSDAAAASATLVRDFASLKGDGLSKATTAAAPLKTLRTDLAHVNAALAGDRLTERLDAVTDEKVIAIDLKHLRRDRKNPTAETADQATLTTDRVKLQNDLLAGLDARISERTTAQATIFSDVQVVVSAVDTDPSSSDKLETDVSKLLADREAKMTTLTADLVKVQADRQQLATDLAAT